MIQITTSEVPSYNERHKRYNASAKGKEREERRETITARKDYLTKRTDDAYLNRPFIAWDGEGITIDGKHKYVMLANSAGGYLEDINGIPTEIALKFFLSERRRLPKDAIHIIFSGGYDINMILGDFEKEDIRGIYKNDYYSVGEYRFQWRQAKTFFVGERDTKSGFIMYDVWPFFQCSFVKACDSYLGDRFLNRDLIVSNKGARASFKPEDMDEIKFYNEQELVNLVELANELRLRLNKVGLRLSRWDGPGAIASALLTKQGVKKAMAVCPPEVARAARFAYAGGRFEVIRNGNVNSPCYEYDVNSAYPYGLGYVPNLQNGEWIYHPIGSIPTIKRETYALCHAYYDGTSPNIPQPLYVRMPNGNIIYPLKAEGWYWGPEIYAAQEHVKRYGGTLTISEVWEFRENDPTDKPFGFIEPLYNKRRALKKAGDGAHVGIKLGLNSLYGKLCQQIGCRILPNGLIKPPPFHQLEWAGFITALCRARVLLAAIDNLESVIAYETDAVFTMAPLNVPVSSNLGDFEETKFSSLLYAVSGLYFATTAEGEEIEKTRGVDRGSITRQAVADAMMQENAIDRRLHATLTRFIGAGLALQTNWNLWRTWQQSPKVIQIAPNTKRNHERCSICNVPNFRGIIPDIWHYTEPYSPITADGHISREFPIVWINPDPLMTDLEELRKFGPELGSMEHE